MEYKHTITYEEYQLQIVNGLTPSITSQYSGLQDSL